VKEEHTTVYLFIVLLVQLYDLFIELKLKKKKKHKKEYSLKLWNKEKHYCDAATANIST